MKTRHLLATCILATGLLAAAGCSSNSGSEDVAAQDTLADQATEDVQADQAAPDTTIDTTIDTTVDDTALPDQTPNDVKEMTGEIPCEPSCDGKQCGDDGCDGSCGECNLGEICNDGQCEPEVCVPDCSWKQCGNDGCDGSCGECEGDSYCGPAFQCIPFDCTPDCFSKECGDDGCDGSCGECGENEECVDGACESTLPNATCQETVYCLTNCLGQGSDLDTCTTQCYALAAQDAVTAAESYGYCAWGNCNGLMDGDATKMACALASCQTELTGCIPTAWGTGLCSAAKTCMEACTDPTYEKCVIDCIPSTTYASMQKYIALAVCTQTSCSCVKNDTACIASCTAGSCSTALTDCTNDGLN